MTKNCSGEIQNMTNTCVLLDSYNKELDNGESVDRILDNCEVLQQLWTKQLAMLDETVGNLEKWTCIQYSHQLREYFEYFNIRLYEINKILKKARQIKARRINGSI